MPSRRGARGRDVRRGVRLSLRFRDEGVDGVGWLYGIGKHLLSRYFRAGAVEARARRRLGMPERTVSDDDYDRIEELIDFERFGEALAEAMSACRRSNARPCGCARRRAELRRGRGPARLHRADGSDARQPGPPTDRHRPRDRPIRRTDRTGAETMATTIDYLNEVHGDLLEAARREARPARRPSRRWVPSTGLVAAVVAVLVAAGLIGLLVRSGGFRSTDAADQGGIGGATGADRRDRRRPGLRATEGSERRRVRSPPRRPSRA